VEIKMEESAEAPVAYTPTEPLAEDTLSGVSMTLSAQAKPTSSLLQRPLVEVGASTKHEVESMMDSPEITHTLSEGFTVHQPTANEHPTSPLTVPALEVSKVTVTGTGSVVVATARSSFWAANEVVSTTATQKNSDSPDATSSRGVSKLGSDAPSTASREPNDDFLGSGDNNPTPKQQASTAGILGGAAILAVACGAVVFLIFHRRRRCAHSHKQSGTAKSDSSLDFQCVGLKQP
jgi:hypothetical protein